MKFAVLSDIHANAHALEAVLADVDPDVDGYLCLGDTIGYGASPGWCLARMASLQATTIAGNHEMLVLGRLSLQGASPLAARSITWTRTVLNQSALTALAALPPAARVRGALLAHGSPGDAQEYVRTDARAAELLGRLDAASDAPELLLLGHTHEQWAVGFRSGTLLRSRPGAVRLSPGERHLLNPGSVGQSRDRRAEARYLLLDTEGLADFRSVPYDVAACRAALRDAGLPEDSSHICPPRLDRVRRGLRRRVAPRLRHRR